MYVFSKITGTKCGHFSGWDALNLNNEKDKGKFNLMEQTIFQVHNQRDR